MTSRRGRAGLRVCGLWVALGAVALGCTSESPSPADGAVADVRTTGGDAAVLDAAGTDAAGTDAATGTDAARDTPGDAPVGVSDAGRVYATDRALFFGAPRCAAAGVQLCDDFEGRAAGSAPDPATWTIRTWGTGSATIDATRGARGTHSVHFQAPGMPASVTMNEHRTFPAAGNTFFGRMFVYMDRIPEPFVWNDTSHYPLVHWTMASATGAFNSGGMTYHPDVRAIGGINRRLLINVDGGPQPEYGIDDMPPMIHDSIVARDWMCFEFEYSGLGASAEMRVWWDGVEHPQLHLSSTNLGNTGGMPWPIPTFDSLNVGFSLYQNYSAIIPTFDVWIDEVAVDSHRIGCSL